MTIGELATELGAMLVAEGLTIATAESCTAGGIGSAIASIDGASRYFRGGVIAYATELKTTVLDVPAEVVERHGVVSRQTAEAMNEGVRRLTHSDVAVSITGYAGSSGGDQFAPNGTIWICAGMTGGATLTECFHVGGARSENLQSAILHALALAVRLLKNAAAAH